MIKIFSQLIDDLCYGFALAEIRIENNKRQDLSYNSTLYRKIICKESGKHTISSIAKLLSVKTTAVTQKVNELESKNYVIRKQSSDDKRVSFLFGVEKFCPCKDAFLQRDKYVFDKLQSEYSSDDINKFLDILKKSNTYYQEYDSHQGG